MKLLVILLLIGTAGLLLGRLAAGATGRKAGRRGRRRTGGVLIGAAFLELQSMLEPEKKVELFLEKEDRTVQEESGEPPR